MSATFNVKDLLPFFGEPESRTTPSQEGEADEDIPSTQSSPPANKSASDIVGPITKSRAKQLGQQMHSSVNAKLMLTDQIISDHSILLSTSFN